MNEQHQSFWGLYPPEFYMVHGWVCALALSLVGLVIMSLFFW
jgi:hypothetical protein